MTQLFRWKWLYFVLHCNFNQGGGGIRSFEWNQLKPRRGSTPPLLAQCQSSIIIYWQSWAVIVQRDHQFFSMIGWSKGVHWGSEPIGGQSPVFFKSWFHLTSEGGYGDTASSYIIPPWLLTQQVSSLHGSSMMIGIQVPPVTRLFTSKWLFCLTLYSQFTTSSFPLRVFKRRRRTASWRCTWRSGSSPSPATASSRWWA